MFRKQISTHLSNGYILVEDRDSVAEAAVRAKSAKNKDDLVNRRDDAADEEDWKAQLRGMDDEVRLNSRMEHNPAGPIIRGLSRPNRLPYIDRRKTAKESMAAGGDLVKMLQKQIMTGMSSTQSLGNMIKSLVGEENKHLMKASKRVAEVAETKHKFIQSIHKNLRNVEQDMNKIESAATSASDDDSYGLVPIRAMFAALNNHSTTIEEMVQKLESSLLSVGINLNTDNEESVFSEFNARVAAATTTAVSNAHMEMRKIMDAINKMLGHVELTVDNFMSNPYKPPDHHSGVDMLPPDLNHLLVDTPRRNDTAAADEMYSFFQNKVATIADLYKILLDRYKELFKTFKDQQDRTMDKVSNEEMAKAKEVDAGRFMVAYKAFYNTQLSFNKTRLAKLEKAFASIERKIEQQELRREKSRSERVNTLRELHTKLNLMLARMDDEEGEGDDDGNMVVQSNEYLEELRKKRERDLLAVGEEYRKNLSSLEKVLTSVPPDQPSTSTQEPPSVNNKSIYEMNKDAYNSYLQMRDEVSESRAKAYKDAAEKNAVRSP